MKYVMVEIISLKDAVRFAFVPAKKIYILFVCSR